jgi:hypothetical protein
VEINLFDAVACFNTLFSDISHVKHNIGLTLFVSNQLLYSGMPQEEATPLP